MFYSCLRTGGHKHETTTILHCDEFLFKINYFLITDLSIANKNILIFIEILSMMNEVVRSQSHFKYKQWYRVELDAIMSKLLKSEIPGKIKNPRKHFPH